MTECSESERVHEGSAPDITKYPLAFVRATEYAELQCMLLNGRCLKEKLIDEVVIVGHLS